MKELTKEQYELLSKFDKDLRSAYYSHTVMGMKIDDLRKLMDVYMELGYRKQNITCHQCVISFLSTLAGIYFAQVQKHIEEEIKQVREEDLANEPIPEEDVDKEAEQILEKIAPAEASTEQSEEVPAEEPVEKPAKPKKK